MTLGESGHLPARREANLVAQFLVLTFVGLALAGVGIVVTVERTLARQAEHQAVERARATARGLLRQQLRRSDFEPAVPAARRRVLAALLASENLGSDSRGATLYTESAVVSSAGAALQTPTSPLVAQARSGMLVSHVETTKSGRTLRTFLPVRLRGVPPAVIEFDQNYDSITAAVQRTSLLVAGILEALLCGLCVLLVPPLARSSGRAREHVDLLDTIASHDGLTGLLNRPGFYRLATETLARSGARGALLLVDLNRFHEINETVGAERGDLLLAQAASRLASIFPADQVARLGEDEFAVLVPRAGRPELTRLSQAIEESFAEPVAISGIRIELGARVGASSYPEHGSDLDTVLRHASIALTQAKSENSRFAIYDEKIGERDLAELGVQSELRDALANGELVVHYQPQVDLAREKIHAVEALIRWQHPQRGLLPAAAFIDVAEQSELISELGRFVVANAVKQWRKWEDEGVSLHVAVNLSTIDLLDLTLPSLIVDLLIEQRMPAEKLTLEITERTLLQEQKSSRVLRQLERIGVGLAIDDYGTGYSSLSALRKLPISQVKIDQTFVAGIPEDADNDTIVQSTIQLAHTLGASVVAEGVETPEQLDRLRALGCDLAQGYFIGRPIGPGQVAMLMKSKTSFELSLQEPSPAVLVS
jgi:diguanylate cyclase (GGDEF)-like protein